MVLLMDYIQQFCTVVLIKYIELYSWGLAWAVIQLLENPQSLSIRWTGRDVVASSQSIRGTFLHVLLSENHKLQRLAKVKFRENFVPFLIKALYCYHRFWGSNYYCSRDKCIILCL